MVWEERWHPLREEWVIVAAHRQNRPWTGDRVRPREEGVPSYDPKCYLCPGNARVSGMRNPDYQTTFVFDNDHPSVGPLAPIHIPPPAGIYRSRPATGIARVVCYSRSHNLTLADLSVDEVRGLLEVWQHQYRDLGSRPQIQHVLVFENKGTVTGVSNPHPHCQIYATNFVFKTIENEARICASYLRETGRTLFGDILRSEEQDGRRILYRSTNAIAFVPYFARYAYEVYVAPIEGHASIADLSDGELSDFGAALKRVLVQYDNLWERPFPYVMVLHQAPTEGEDCSGFHFHIEIHPPMRKPSLLKYLAGPEIGGGNFLSDTAPEEKAAELRSQPDIHYKQRSNVLHQPTSQPGSA